MTPAALRWERRIKVAILTLALLAILVTVGRAYASGTRCESTVCLRAAVTWQKGENARLRHELARKTNRDAGYAVRLAAAAYNLPERDMRTIARCESGMGVQKTAEAGSGASGLFQFLPSTFARTPFAHFSVFDPVANALAAGWLVTKDHGWREWSCSSITGVR